jgi:DNA-binding response OmpR family regulator
MANNAPRVLIIDDQSETVARLLDGHEGQELELLVALDGQAGLAKAVAQLPDLILLDVVLPVIDGLEVCRRLKADPRTADVPVIFLSQSAAIEHKLQSFSLGAVDYIGKPFSEHELLARIFIHLHNKWQLDRLQAMLGQRALTGVGDKAFPDEQLFARALAMLDKRLDNPPGLTEMAVALGANERKLTDLFRERVGLTVFEYFSELRLETARHLLEGSTMQIQAIATHIGYRNAGDFTRAYRRRYGTTPREHRRHAAGSQARPLTRAPDPEILLRLA